MAGVDHSVDFEFFHSNDGWGGAWSQPCSGASSAASSRASSESEGTFPYRVVMLGAAGVGKTTLCHQFMTSDHINGYDSSLGKWTLRRAKAIMGVMNNSDLMKTGFQQTEFELKSNKAKANYFPIIR